ncbi:spermidine/putrescine-binding periplasmic protein-like [Oleiphilus messinensis]|uniref:Spermidine/putrescine-binding periplasmic protein-like n=1 Tax=Oleiphilus messinensis TaxID=141451 RepID=A0A1Y0IIE7_9GAMM|nr:extracellular solute-binding protein [Oleiphilus messinensis]ARU59203.1 spermidine/putrescine-binding periplasmic protein-like [Oleiphilus messinensis]
MLYRLKTKLFFVVWAMLACTVVRAETLNVFTWEGYVLPDEVEAVNKLLKEQGYDYTVNVVSPWAEGPEQMFKVIRGGEVDISFLTLNYIKMQEGKLLKLLQPINVDSPRLSNYQHLSKSLTGIPMALDPQGKPVYIPWGGGAYGIWANMDKLSEADLPKSVAELWDAKWTGKLSLSSGQIQPNIALASLALGKAPFFLNDIRDNQQLRSYSEPNSTLQQKVNGLYKQVGKFWDAGPEFSDDLSLVASYGPGASAHNAAGGNWKLVEFSEGNTVWLDTINFHRNLAGKKLEAAEIFANYFIGKQVQERVVNGLGMVAASSLVDANELLDKNPNFFSEQMFWPPYNKLSDNVMRVISDRAMKQ